MNLENALRADRTRFIDEAKLIDRQMIDLRNRRVSIENKLAAIDVLLNDGKESNEPFPNGTMRHDVARVVRDAGKDMSTREVADALEAMGHPKSHLYSRVAAALHGATQFVESVGKSTWRYRNTNRDASGQTGDKP